MRIIRKVLRMGGIWLALGVCLWAAGAACLNMATSDPTDVHVSMRYAPNRAPSFEGIEQFYNELEYRRDTPPEGMLTAWAEERGGGVSSTEWNSNAAVDVYYVDGDMSRVMPLKLIAGGFVDRTDSQGIAIDVETAVKLFGSTEPIGLKASMLGQDVYVRGVFEKPEKLLSWGTDTGNGMLVTSGAILTKLGETGGTGVKVQAVEVTLPAGLSPDEARQAASRLAGEMGLGGAAVTWEHSGNTSLLRQALQLPGWMMMISGIWMLLRAALSSGGMMIRLGVRRAKSRTIPARVARNTFIRAAIIPLVLLTLAAGVLLVVKPSFFLPPAYIPTQWSDTGFWVELVKKSLLEHAARGVLTTPRPDGIRTLLTNTGMLFILASAACFALLGKSLSVELGPVVYKRMKQRPDALPAPPRRWEGAAFASMMVIAAVTPAAGMLLSNSLGLWAVPAGNVISMQSLPAMYIAIQLMIRLWPSALWPVRTSPKKWFAGMFAAKRPTGEGKPPKDTGTKKRRFPQLVKKKKVQPVTEQTAPVTTAQQEPAIVYHKQPLPKQKPPVALHKPVKRQPMMPPARRRRGIQQLAVTGEEHK